MLLHYLYDINGAAAPVRTEGTGSKESRFSFTLFYGHRHG